MVAGANSSDASYAIDCFTACSRLSYGMYIHQSRSSLHLCLTILHARWGHTSACHDAPVEHHHTSLGFLARISMLKTPGYKP